MNAVAVVIVVVVWSMGTAKLELGRLPRPLCQQSWQPPQLRHLLLSPLLDVLAGGAKVLASSQLYAQLAHIIYPLRLRRPCVIIGQLSELLLLSLLLLL